MNKELFQAYDAIPWPPRGELKFVDEIREYAELPFTPHKKLHLVNPELCPETALFSLKRHFILDETGVPLYLVRRNRLAPEEFSLAVTDKIISLAAADDSGFRYGICELEERLADGEFTGTVRLKPWVKHRISRCFFAPNTRPPLKLDELTDDVDYYPEAYLDRIMHERLNGVWLTIYLNDMPSSAFPERGRDADARLAKLKRVAERCAKYGIKCYIFMAEPRNFSGRWKSNTLEEMAAHPELSSRDDAGNTYFCTSTAEGKRYIAETVGYLFSKVPELGGIINIMSLESAHPCAERKLYPHIGACRCPRCSKFTAPQLYSEIARVFSRAMKHYNPEAEFFGWFYSGFHMPGEPENDVRLAIAEAWPAECTLIHNCETGGENPQCGKTMIVQDYSLSWPGPSGYWRDMAARAPKIGAKMQTGCSHEDATVPYLPVPGVLFERYHGLHQAENCAAVMQCWYFGSVPSVMNRAAGRLSCDPMPESEPAFLEELARPGWGNHAAEVARAWELFSRSYRNFPETIAFKWFGPLHASIAFPWYAYPADLPIAPSFTQAFPKNSGDRIGECVGYGLNFAEVRQLLRAMDELWRQGLEILRPCADTPLRKMELGVAETIGIQFASSRRFFEFYHLRDDMIFNGHDNLKAMKALAEAELKDTLILAELCRNDSRLGYHSEVESYCFFPEKLTARAELLKDVLNDLDHYDADSPEIRRYRGDDAEAVELCRAGEWRTLGGLSYQITANGKELVFAFKNPGEGTLLEVEPGRLCQVIAIPFSAQKHSHNADFIPGLRCEHDRGTVKFAFDRAAFAGFRVSERMYWRFNISTPRAELAPRHPWPGRLQHGTSNSGDLLFLAVK